MKCCLCPLGDVMVRLAEACERIRSSVVPYVSATTSIESMGNEFCCTVLRNGISIRVSVSPTCGSLVSSIPNTLIGVCIFRRRLGRITSASPFRNLHSTPVSGFSSGIAHGVLLSVRTAWYNRCPLSDSVAATIRASLPNGSMLSVR